MEKKLTAFRLVIFIIFALILFLPYWSFAAQDSQVGKVVAIRGDVIAVNLEAESRKLFIKAPVFLNDTIKSKQGRIQLMFEDNTLITLGRNSEMKISKFSWKPGDKNSAMETDIREGSFRIMGGAITKIAPDNFKTNAPSGTIGIRGSMYACMIKDSSMVVVFQGGTGIYVNNSAGMVNISTPGFATKVKSSSSTPEKPKKLTREETIELENALVEVQTQEKESTALVQVDDKTGEEHSADKPDVAGSTLHESDAVVAVVDETIVFSAQADFASEPEPKPESKPEPEPEPPSYPTSGVTNYTGTVAGSTTLASDSSVENISTTSFAEINWHNGKIIGRFPSGSSLPPVFYVGDVSEETISGITFFGSGDGLSDPSSNQITAYSGSGSGTVIGLDKGGYSIGFSGNGYAVQPAGQDLLDTWTVTDSASRGTQIPEDDIDDIAPVGVTSWKGHVVGISEDMDNIDVDRRLFITHDLGSFALNLDKNAGTVTGSLTVENAITATSFLNNLAIGGNASAYILDDNFGADLACPGGNCVSTYSATGPLKNYGNFLVSVNPQDPNSEIGDYVTWGYWEAAYIDPSTGGQYHTHVPGSRWIAGEPTPVAEVNDLITTSFVGNYSGTTFASKIDTTVTPGASQVTDLQGTFNLTVDFGNIAAASAITGTLSLPDIVMNVSSGIAGNATANGFANGSVNSLTQSDFKGAFYGPNAKSIGGNYYADFGTGVSYIGIFAGNR